MASSAAGPRRRPVSSARAVATVGSVSAPRRPPRRAAQEVSEVTLDAPAEAAGGDPSRPEDCAGAVPGSVSPGAGNFQHRRENVA